MASCEFSSNREAGGQWDFVPVGLFNSVRTECWSQAGLLGNRVPSRLQLAPRLQQGSQPLSTAITLRRHKFDENFFLWPSSKNVQKSLAVGRKMDGIWWRSARPNLNSLSVVLEQERDVTINKSLPRAAKWILTIEAPETTFYLPTSTD